MNESARTRQPGFVGYRRRSPRNARGGTGRARTITPEHGGFLNDDVFVSGGLRAGRRPAGPCPPAPVCRPVPFSDRCGAAQCSRWLAGRASPLWRAIVDGMLARAVGIDRRRLAQADAPVPLIQCDGSRLALWRRGVRAVFTAYGWCPSSRIRSGDARGGCVPRPGGASSFHDAPRSGGPSRPRPRGLTVHQSYFDTRPCRARRPRAPDPRRAPPHARAAGPRDRRRRVVVGRCDRAGMARAQHPGGGWSPCRRLIGHRDQSC